MKKFIAFAILFFLMFNVAYSQDTTVTYYNKNWEPILFAAKATYYRKAYKNENNTWVANDYFKSNNIQMRGAYKSKRLKLEHGDFEYFYENGNKKSGGKFLNGKKTGEWTYWFENGQKKSQGSFLQDKRAGEWIFWSEKGVLEDKEFYTEGNVTKMESYYNNGVKEQSGQYLNGRPHGLWTYWNKEGRVIMTGLFKYGMRDGTWTKYFKTGSMDVVFKNGVQIGKELGGAIKRGE